MEEENAQDMDKSPVQLISRRLADIPPEPSELGAERAQTQKEKRTQAAGKKRARNVGQLKSMLRMPVDVLFEITSHLHPLDLLQLSRVSSDFRALFATRSARHMWVASRRNVPYLPDCPQDLSELEYARLLFEIDCEACGRVPRSDAVHISYNIRMHFCKQCLSLNVKKGSTILRIFKKTTRSKLPPTIFTMVPTYETIYRDGTLNGSYNAYYKPELEQVVSAYLELTDLAERDEFVRRRQTLTNILMETGRELREYKLMERTLKGQELQKLLSDRKTEIQSRLNELGYTEDDFTVARRYVSWQWAHLIEQPKPVTALSWNVMRPKLTGVIEDGKAKENEAKRSRLKSERRRETTMNFPEFLEQNLGRMQRNYIRHEVDFSALPSVQALVEAEEYTVPVTLDRLASATANILADCQAHRQVMRHDLATEFLDPIAKQSTAAADIDVDAVLSSAIALFGCMCRREPLPLEDFLIHRHFINCRETWRSLMDVQRDVIQSDYGEFSWTDSRTLRARSRIMSRAAKDVLAALSLPPDTKLELLKGMGPRFNCACNQGSAHGPNTAMTFLGLVTHVVEQQDIFRRVTTRFSMVLDDLLANLGHSFKETSVRYTGAEANDDHQATLLPSLLTLSPARSAIPPAVSCTNTSDGRNVCTLCYALGGELIKMHCLVEAATHMKQKHHLDDVLDYYMMSTLTMQASVRKLYEERPNLPV